MIVGAHVLSLLSVDLYHKDNVSVLIGPGCSGDITVCGKLATYYGLPLVTGVGDLVLGKESYPTLTRLSYSLEKQSGRQSVHVCPTDASVTHSRLWLPFEIRQRYDTKSEKVGLLSSMIWNVLSLSERSRIRS